MLLPRRLPSSPICTRRPCSSTACLFVMNMLRTERNKTHDTEALVRACSSWAIRGSKNTDMLFWKDVGNGILLDRPLPFKSHQSYRPLPCFIPALQEIWSGPAKTVRWWRWWPQHRGWHLITAVKRLCGYRHSPIYIYIFFFFSFFY